MESPKRTMKKILSKQTRWWSRKVTIETKMNTKNTYNLKQMKNLKKQCKQRDWEEFGENFESA